MRSPFLDGWGGIGLVPKAVLILFVISGEFIKEDFWFDAFVNVSTMQFLNLRLLEGWKEFPPFPSSIKNNNNFSNSIIYQLLTQQKNQKSAFKNPPVAVQSSWKIPQIIREESRQDAQPFTPIREDYRGPREGED